MAREQSLRKSSSKTTSSKRSLALAHCLTRCRLVARNAGNTLTSRLLPPPAPARALPALCLLTLSRLQLPVGMKWMLAQQWIWASGCRWPLSSCKIVTNCLWRPCLMRDPGQLPPWLCGCPAFGGRSRGVHRVSFADCASVTRPHETLLSFQFFPIRRLQPVRTERILCVPCASQPDHSGSAGSRRRPALHVGHTARCKIPVTLPPPSPSPYPLPLPYPHPHPRP